MAQVGLQLYTVREAMEKDFEGTLRKVAELGYQGVEFAGFYGRSAEQVISILNETGLIALGAHTPYTNLRDQLEEEISFNLAIGNRFLICPFLSEEDRNRWNEVIEDLKVIGKRCSEAGVVLCYHNHEFELTQLLGDKTVLDTMYDEVPSSLLQVELDSCWVSYAGYDPLQYIAKYSDRLPILHLKDMIIKEDGSPETVELGKGQIAIKAIADAAVAAGVKWLVVEQDYCAQDPIESIKVSMDWIKGYATQGGNLNV